MVGCTANDDPIEPASLAEHVASTILSSLSPTTIKMYGAVWKQFTEFVIKMSAKGVTEDINFSHIMSYLSYLSRQGLASSTIISKFSALSYVFKLRKLPDPSKDFYVTKYLSGIKKLNPQVDSRIPISLDLLHKMCDLIATLGYPYYKMSLFQAMLLMAFQMKITQQIVVVVKDNP